jgi:hypothetical protein
MKRKYSTDEVSSIFAQKGAVLKSEYRNMHTRLRGECSIEGCTEEFEIELCKHLYRGQNRDLQCHRHMFETLGRDIHNLEVMSGQSYRDAWAQQTEKGKACRKRIQGKYQNTENGKIVFNRYRKKRFKNDPLYLIAHNLRGRFHDALQRKNLIKSVRTFDLIGSSPIELGIWFIFLSNWTAPGASLENYGQWQIDHRIPVARWDLRCPLQQFLCFHWTNLQPLWLADHKIKTRHDKCQLITEDC